MTGLDPQLCSRLVMQRTLLGLSQRDLAALMGTTQSAVCDLESGRFEPRLTTLQRWAEALNLRLTVAVEAGGES